jgi:dTDP-glucose pyrophosphorylase
MIAVLPMAGRGSRFSGSGYSQPKPLIPIDGTPMFALALGSIAKLSVRKLIVITLEEHDEHFNASELIEKHSPYPTEIVKLKDVTEGQLCTVMAAKEHIRLNEDILIVSSDTIIISNLHDDIRNKRSDCKGIISVANMPGDRWSFAKTDSTGRVVDVAEKVRISDHASTGLYYFSNGIELCDLADEILLKKEKTKGEYYVIPVYQKYINRGDFIGISVATQMWDLGTPESLQHYFSARKNQE